MDPVIADSVGGHHVDRLDARRHQSPPPRRRDHRRLRTRRGCRGRGAHATADGPPEQTAPVVKTRDPRPVPQVTNVRYASHGRNAPGSGYDRVVFDLAGKPSGYDVRYAPSGYRPFDCEGHDNNDVAGSRFLLVTLKPAGARDKEGNSTYRGPGGTSSARLGLPTVEGIRMCEWDGHVSFALGLDHKAGFFVWTLSNPTRIYIDIAH